MTYFKSGKGMPRNGKANLSKINYKIELDESQAKLFILNIFRQFFYDFNGGRRDA